MVSVRTLFHCGVPEGGRWTWRKPYVIHLLTWRHMPFHLVLALFSLRLDLILKCNDDIYEQRVGGLWWLRLMLRLYSAFTLELAIPVFWTPKQTELEYRQAQHAKDYEAYKAYDKKTFGKIKHSSSVQETRTALDQATEILSGAGLTDCLSKLPKRDKPDATDD